MSDHPDLINYIATADVATLTDRAESDTLEDPNERLPRLAEALADQDLPEAAKLLAPLFDDELQGADYDLIVGTSPELADTHLRQMFLAREPFLAYTPHFLDKTVKNYADTTINSILHLAQSLLDEAAAVATTEAARTEEVALEEMVLEQLATRELLMYLQETLIEGESFNEIINSEIDNNGGEIAHISLILGRIADQYGINKALLTGDRAMRTQPEIWSMLTSRRVLRAPDTNYRRNANGIAGSHHSLLPLSSTPRSMLANSMSGYMPFIEAVSSSEYKYSSTFGFVHLIGMDEDGETYSVEHPLMMYDRRLSSVGSEALDGTLAKIDSLYSNHDLWHNLIPVYADHFILHHPDAPLSSGGRRDAYVGFGKEMRTHKEEYEIGVAMAHAMTQQEQFELDPSLKDAQVDIVRQVISGSSALYEDLISHNVPAAEAVDMVDFAVMKAMTRLYNILPGSDEIYYELDRSIRLLGLPKITVDMADVGKRLLLQGLVDTDALAASLKVEKDMLPDAVASDSNVANEAILLSDPENNGREPDSEYVYEALLDIGLVDKAIGGETEVELDGMDKVRWIAMNAPQREQLKGHMEKVHGKAGSFRFGEKERLVDVRELVALQQAALLKDSPHYLYRAAARKTSQRLSYAAYSFLFDDGQDLMKYERGDVQGLIGDSAPEVQALGIEVVAEIDKIIHSLSYNTYSHDPEDTETAEELQRNLFSLGYERLARSLQLMFKEYSQLRINEIRYQSSIGISYTYAAKRIDDNQMTIA